ncbi:MAG: lysophospholipid acyltransferase family protein [Actinomycetota bacterium]
MRERELNWVWTIGAPLVHAVLAMVFRIRIEGIEHVPRTGAAVLAPNHVSVLDGPAVSAITGTRRGRATRNLIAAEVFHGPIGWILHQAGQVPIDRGRGDTGALDEAAGAACDGSCVGIFPEGRVGDDPRSGPQRIRSGLTRIAIPSGAPVVPVGIWGTQAVWPREGLERASLLRRHTMALVYGDPLIAHPGESPTGFRGRYRAALEDAVSRARTIAGAEA